MFVFNHLDIFIKTNSSLYDFKTRRKNQLHFPSVKIPSVKKGVTHSDIKIFNHLPSNILEIQENKMLFKSVLRKHLLTHLFDSVEEFLVCYKDIN
jgi:hypothetical protein